MTKTFTQTSDKPYDRHKYKLIYSNSTFSYFDYYEDLKAVWFQTPALFLSHVEVEDKSKGFKS